MKQTNLAGSGAAPATTLNTARIAMHRQTAPSGELIGVIPQYVLVPPELETDTEKQLTVIQAVSAHCLVRIAPGILIVARLRIALSELLPEY